MPLSRNLQLIFYCVIFTAVIITCFNVGIKRQVNPHSRIILPKGSEPLLDGSSQHSLQGNLHIFHSRGAINNLTPHDPLVVHAAITDVVDLHLVRVFLHHLDVIEFIPWLHLLVTPLREGSGWSAARIALAEGVFSRTFTATIDLSSMIHWHT